jgi:hypothetical protein
MERFEAGHCKFHAICGLPQGIGYQFLLFLRIVPFVQVIPLLGNSCYVILVLDLCC